MFRLIKRLNALEKSCEAILSSDPQENVEKSEKPENISLKVKAFNNIVNECKNESHHSTKEHKYKVLHDLFNINKLEESTQFIDQFTNNHLNNDNNAVSEKKILLLKEVLQNVSDAIDTLFLELEEAIEKSNHVFSFQGLKIKRTKKYLSRLLPLKEKLEVKLEKDSQTLSKLILDDFYNIYILFSFMILLLIEEQKDFALMEVNRILGRYESVMKPAFEKRFLHQSDMLYYYGVYELNGLEKEILAYLKAKDIKV